MQALRNANKVLYIALQTVVKLCLVLPLIAAIAWVNYLSLTSVDSAPAPLSEEELYNIAIAKALLGGQNLKGYDQLDEREILALYAEYLETPLDTIALGSSRVLQLNNAISGSTQYFNCGMSGADFYDILGTFYLFDRADKLPKNMIIALDPWLLNADAFTSRSNEELYNEFLTLKLGVDKGYKPAEPEPEEPVEITFSDLLNIDTFRQSVFSPVQPKTEELLPEIKLPLAEGDIYDQPVNIKLADGSVMYTPAFRNSDPETVEAVARVDAGNFLWMENYTAPDPERCEIFERFIQYAQQRGVNVVLVMIPYHPTVYSFATENSQRWPGFFETEPWFINFALENDIPLYGSYNPFVTGCWQQDFYDGLHIKGEALQRIFPGISQVLQEQQQGQAGSAYHFWEPRISPETALQIAQYYSPIQPPHEYRQNGTVIINSEDCYLIERYSGSSKIASYAVGLNDGLFYRYDTTHAEWVIDKRF